MPAFPYGSVYLNALQFDTDPSTYEPLRWPKRISVHPTIGGGVKIQDFGLWAKDLQITLASTGGKGDHQFMREPLVKSILGLYAARGVSYQLLDWIGNEFQVVIMGFDVTPFMRGKDHLGATIQTYDYEMALRVTSITALAGTPYSGS